MKYGQQEYDFDEGLWALWRLTQVFSLEQVKEGKLRHSGWMILVHPDLLYGTSLLKKCAVSKFFDYSVNEALFLSDKRRKRSSLKSSGTFNRKAKPISINSVSLLLLHNWSWCWATRKGSTSASSSPGKWVIIKSWNVWRKCWLIICNNDELIRKGLPTVTWIAEALNISPNYLSGLLKVQTGQSTQQHIHDKLIEKAKEKLSTTSLTVSEIAYELGFEHPQSFSKFFKAKTNRSPLDFRQSFN